MTQKYINVQCLKAHRKYPVYHIFITTFNVIFSSFCYSSADSGGVSKDRVISFASIFVVSPRLNEDIESRVTGSRSFLCSTRSGSAANYRRVADNLLNKFMPGVLTF